MIRASHRSLSVMGGGALRVWSRQQQQPYLKLQQHVMVRDFMATPVVRMGIDDFMEKANEDGTPLAAGRAWTAAELRRKGFDDLHKLWYVLYKERNLLLSLRERSRGADRALARNEENRYRSVKKSMAGIKLVLKERRDLAEAQAAAAAENGPAQAAN